MTPPLGRSFPAVSSTTDCAVVVSDRRFEPHPYQLQYPFIGNPLFEELHQFIMGNGVEIRTQVSVVYLVVSSFQMFTYCGYRLSGGSSGAKPV
jgi:hypothetical protein